MSVFFRCIVKYFKRKYLNAVLSTIYLRDSRLIGLNHTQINTNIYENKREKSKIRRRAEKQKQKRKYIIIICNNNNDIARRIENRCSRRAIWQHFFSLKKCLWISAKYIIYFFFLKIKTLQYVSCAPKLSVLPRRETRKGRLLFRFFFFLARILASSFYGRILDTVRGQRIMHLIWKKSDHYTHYHLEFFFSERVEVISRCAPFLWHSPSRLKLQISEWFNPHCRRTVSV